jgi:Tfp pilus assembly protein PilF
MLGKILLALMLVQSAGNQSRGLIRGQIIVPVAHASERILVVLQKSDGPLIGRNFTDSLGHYEFPALLPGNYVLIVNVEGYEDVRQEVGVGAGVYAIQTVNIPLREKVTLITIHSGGGPDDETVDMNELGRKYPRKAVQDYEKSIDEIRKGSIGKSFELLNSVLKLAPDFYSAHNTLGTLYQKTGRFPEAEDEYRRARELNPKSATPLVNLGSLFIDEAVARAGDREAAGKILDNALDILEEALKMKRTAPAYFFLGTAYYRSSFYEEAEQNLKHALELDAHMGAIRLMLANVYLKQQKWQNALEHLDAYLSENPKASDHSQIEETRFQVARKMKQYE